MTQNMALSRSYSLAPVQKKKSVRAITFARPACWGPGIALWSRTSKLQKPHADMIYYKYVINTTCLWIYHTTRHLLSASFLTPNEIFQVSTSQERASSKRFSYVCFPPTEPRWLLRTVSDANLVKYFGLNNNRLKKMTGNKGLGQKGWGKRMKQ